MQPSGQDPVIYYLHNFHYLSVFSILRLSVILSFGHPIARDSRISLE